MSKFVLIKSICLLMASALICIAVTLFPSGDHIRADMVATALGAIYLLKAWLEYNLSRGRDFFKLLRRAKPPEPPLFHTNFAETSLKQRFWLMDDYFDTNDLPREVTSPRLFYEANALSFMFSGICMIVAGEAIFSYLY